MMLDDPPGFRGGVNETLRAENRRLEQRALNEATNARFWRIAAIVSMVITYGVLSQKTLPNLWEQFNGAPLEPTTTDASVFEPEATMAHEVREFQLQIWVRLYWPRRWPAMNSCDRRRCKCTGIHHFAPAMNAQLLPFPLTN